jgi:hypothetical protein
MYRYLCERRLRPTVVPDRVHSREWFLQSNASSAGSASTPTSASSVTSGTSTAALLQALANAQNSGGTTASNTPITLSGAAQNITQLSAPADSIVSYAQTGSTGVTANGSGSAGTGGATSQQSPSSVSTFTSSDMSNTAVSNVIQPDSGVAGSNDLPILAALKAEVLSVIGFLATHVQPFGGVLPEHISSE